MSEPAKDEAELVEMMAAAMAKHFSMNNAPHMSGNPLNRLGALERRRLDDATKAALAAIRAAGWAVVPVEPTFNMESEGSVAMVKLGYLPSPGEVAEIYRAMLAAAPGAKP
jgi:hypothetical protein